MAVQVVTAEVYCKALSNLIVYVLDRVKPDPSTTSTATVVAIAKLENYLRKSVFGAFNREQPFSAHALLESTVQRWVDGARHALLDQVRLPEDALRSALRTRTLPTHHARGSPAHAPRGRWRSQMHCADSTRLLPTHHARGSPAPGTHAQPALLQPGAGPSDRKRHAC